MDTANKLELHYYLREDSHQIDAFVRNKCEAELLAIISEVSSVLEVEARVIAEAVQEGGFREFWKLVKDNPNAISVVLLAVQILVSTAPLVLESEKEELEKELIRLQIEESKHNLELLRKDAKSEPVGSETVKMAVSHLSKNLKIIKRKSNFYVSLNTYPEVAKIGFSILDDEFKKVSEEKIVLRKDFSRFILSSNKLRAEEVETEIEIVSPVLKEGRYKWKGIYDGQSINFDMLDLAFKDSVFIENIPFQHGTYIICVLRISRELDEVGEVKVTGYSVTTVIEKLDGSSSQETEQGKRYRHAKKYMDNQGSLFT